MIHSQRNLTMNLFWLYFESFLAFQCLLVVGYVDIQRHCVPQDEILPDMEGATPESWSNDALEIHNKLRELHGSPPMTLNKDLCRSAQSVASKALSNRLTRREADQIPPKVNCTENVWISNTVDWRNKTTMWMHPEVPIMQWYSEVVHYKRPNSKQDPKNLTAVSQFTAMIWKDSKETCTVYAREPYGRHIYIVSHYYPPGNVRMKFRENIQPTSAGLGSEGGSMPASMIPISIKYYGILSITFLCQL